MLSQCLHTALLAACRITMHVTCRRLRVLLQWGFMSLRARRHDELMNTAGVAAKIRLSLKQRYRTPKADHHGISAAVSAAVLDHTAVYSTLHSNPHAC